jgi:hypothetical protein
MDPADRSEAAPHRDSPRAVPPSYHEPTSGETPSKEVRHAPGRGSCGGSLIAVDGGDAAVYPFRCKRWRCASCGARLVREVRKRISAGLGVGEVRFLTITSPGTETPAESLDQLARRWKRLHQRLIRRFGAVEYVVIVELQGRGSPHLHVLVRGPFIPQRWLGSAAAAVGFGRVASVGRAHGGLAGYLTKAIGPGTVADSLPRGFQRVRWSRGWSIPVARRSKRQWPSWYLALADTRRAALSAVHRGYRVVALVHGPPDRWRTWRPIEWRPVRSLCTAGRMRP